MSDENTATAEEAVVESTTSTDSTATKTAKAETSASDKGNAIPQERLNEVIGQRNDYKAQLETMETQFSERQGELSQMIELLKSRDEDAAILTRIREMASTGNEQEKEIVNNLDLILQGKHDEIADIEKAHAEGDTEGAEAKTVQLLKETKAEIGEAVVETRNDLLLMKADLLSEKYFDALPDQYTDKDKEVLNTLLTNNVDWDKIESNPDSIKEEIAKGFETTLEFFGDPRGSVAEKTEVTESTTETESTSESEIPEYLSTDWGEMKEVQLPDGKTTIQPVQSEGDFRSALAQALKRG